MGTIDLSSFIWPDADQGRQPQNTTAIDWSNPIAQGLQELITAGMAVPRTQGSAVNISSTAAGLAYTVSGSGGGAAGTVMIPVAPVTSKEWSFLVLGTSTIASGSYESIVDFNDGLATPTSRTAVGTYAYSSGWTGYDSRPYNTNYNPPSSAYTWPKAGTNLVIVTVSVVGNAIRLYLNGVPATNSTLSSTAASTIANIQLFSKAGTTYTDHTPSGSVVLVGFWNRALTSGEVASLYANPWQLFKNALPGFVMPSGATLAGIAASGFDVTIGSATIGGTGAIAATGLDVTTGTALVGGTITLGTISGFDATYGAAAISGTGALSATGLDVTTGNASVGGTNAVTATGLDVTTGSASITGAGAISAAGLDATTGSAAIAGTGAIAATGLDVTTGADQVSGIGAISASGLDVATGSAQVTGTGAGAVSASGFDVTTGSAAISGAGALAETALDVGTGSALVGGTVQIAVAGFDATTGAASIGGLAHIAGAANDVTYGSSATTGVGAVATTGLNAEFGNATVQVINSGGVAQISATGLDVTTGRAAVSIFTIPDRRRIYRVPPENRTFVVPPENRIFKVK